MKEYGYITRKQFLSRGTNISLTILSASALASTVSCRRSPDSDQLKGGGVDETAAERAPGKNKGSGKLGVALVGLGGYSTDQLAPALLETEHCRLVGIVSGTQEKREKWIRKYNLDERNVYDYSTFDNIKDNDAIDIVYIVLPNAMHKEYVIRAAKAGKHVICEKPMAITTGDCKEMIFACANAGKKLSIGYRLHFEPYNLEVARVGTEKLYGNIKSITAYNGQKEVKGWRLDKELAGGGSLVDVGIYCVQAVRYATGSEPISVTARFGEKTDPKKFAEVEDNLTWEMEMPNNVIAHCKTSYSKDMNRLRVDEENGFIALEPAYEYKGIDGKTKEGALKLPSVNQQALQMDDFARAIKDNRDTPVPGEMGLQDVRIIEAIYESARTGNKIIVLAGS
jgi:predicted dehydrogenase